MTTPSGRPGFSVIDRFGITGDDGSVPDLVNRTQEVITGVLKERMKASPGWNGSTADVWANLRRGIPLDHALLEVIVNRLTGGLVTFPTKQDAIMALKKVPGLDDLVELLTGVEDGDENDLGTFFLNVRRFFESVDFTDPDFDPAVVHKAFVEIVVQPFIKTITEITSALLGPLSIGFLTDEIQTLLFEGGFDDPVTIVPGPGVEHDATDGVPLTTPLGCAKVTCDGTDKSRATEVIKVGPNWVLKLGGRIKYQGLTAGADAIRLNLIPYSNRTTPVPGGAIMVATAGTVSGTSTGVNGWRVLPIEGSWTVPATGVSHVVVEWHVTDAATAGVVKFDELYLQSTEKIPQSFTKDLPEDLQTLVNEAIDLWQGLGERLHVDEWDDWLADTWAHTQAEANQIRDVLAGLIVTPINSAVQSIKDWWTGIVGKTQNLTSGGTIPPASVGGVGGAPNIGKALEDTWNKFWDGVNGLTGSTGKTAADVQEAASTVTTTATSAVNAAQTAAALATYAGGRALWESANPTIDATMLEASLGTGSTPTYFTASQTASAMGFVRTRVAQDKTIVQWIGRGNSLTTAKLHVYRLNTTTGDLTWVQTKNIVPATLPTAVAFARVIVQLDAAVHMEPGDVLALEVCVTGGTHDIAGLTIGWLTPDDSALPKGPGASRNSGTESAAPTTIASANVPYGTKIPFIGAGIPQAELPPPSLAYYFTDTFNSLSAWTILSGAWQANSGSAVNPTGNPGFLLYNNSVLTDRARASFVMPGVKGGSFGTGFSSGSVIRFFMLADSTGANGIAFEVESNGAGAAFSVRLVSFIAGVRTVRATTTATIPDGSTSQAPSISYDPDTKTYRASHSIGSLMEWTDSGNLMPHGPDYRRLLLFSDFGTVSNPGPEYSGVCASITYYDVT